MKDWPLVPPGIWLSLHRRALDTPRPALLLDRDGVIVEDPGYLSRVADVRLVEGIAELIGAANAADIPVGVVTNQSGIARGLFGWDEFAAIEAEIARLLAVKGAQLDATAACPFHPDFTPDYGPAHALWRKPGPGLVDLLADRLNIDRSSSWLIGDQQSDIEAARQAGLAGAVLISAEDNADEDAAQGLADDYFETKAAPDLEHASGVVLPRLIATTN